MGMERSILFPRVGMFQNASNRFTGWNGIKNVKAAMTFLPVCALTQLHIRGELIRRMFAFELHGEVTVNLQYTSQM